MGRAYSKHGEKRNVYRVLMEKPEGNRSLERTRRRRDNTMKMNLRDK
jgi:hypothetical protein